MSSIIQIIIIFCSFLTSCQTASYKDVYIDLASEEVTAFAKEVNQSDGLILFGDSGQYFDNIRSIYLTFLILLLDVL